jgi:YHS domain-containing protein
MLSRYLIWAVLLLVVWRAVRRLLAGIAQGASTPRERPAASPGKGELMVRDPVCGTFVLPSRALAYRDKSGTHHFCSDTCRQAYHSR